MADTSSILAALQGVDPADAMPFGAAATPQGSPTALSGILHGLMNMPNHLIDAAKEAPPAGTRREDYTDVPGSAQPGDKLASEGLNTAVGLAGTGAPAAEAGAVGIFGGKLANGADLRMLNEAKKAASNGYLNDEIRRGTGWFMSPADRQWRFEIPDNNMRLRFNPESHAEGDSIVGAANGLVDHKSLFQAYPQLGNIPMESVKNSNLFDAGSNVPRATGAYYPKQPKGPPPHITTEGPNTPEITSTLAHELQHGVQDIEGFASGADPSHYSNLIMQGWRKNPGVLEGKPLANVLNEAYPLYRKTAGEVESRNVQNRLLWTPQQREMIHPWASQDTPYRDQVVYDPTAGTIRALRGK